MFWLFEQLVGLAIALLVIWAILRAFGFVRSLFGTDKIRDNYAPNVWRDPKKPR